MGFSLSVHYFSGGGVNANHSVLTCSPSSAPKNKTGDGKGNPDREWNFCPGKEAEIALFLQMTRIRNNYWKNLWSKLVDYSPKQDDHKQWALKHRNKPNESKSTNHKSQTMTFWTRSGNHVFPERSAKIIDRTEKPKIALKFATRIARYNKFDSESPLRRKVNITHDITLWTK